MKRGAMLGVILACGASSIAAPALATDTVRASYSIHLIGLPLGTANLTSVLDPSSYRIDISARLTGIAAVISSSRAAGMASGIFTAGRVAPNAYATTSASGDATRTVRIAMNAGNVKAAEIFPPFQDKPGRVPVLEIHRHNIIDPLSALVMPVPGAEPVLGPAACNRVLPIYDGWARFDVELSFTGVRPVKTRGYAGDVAVCAARYRAVAGHLPDRPGLKFMEENRDMEVWLAPVGNSRFVIPYRISVATMVGTTVIEATHFEAQGATRAAAR